MLELSVLLLGGLWTSFMIIVGSSTRSYYNTSGRLLGENTEDRKTRKLPVGGDITSVIVGAAAQATQGRSI